jgi:hypothetical protein
MGGTGHVCMEQMKNAYRILAENSGRISHLRNPDMDERLI